MLRKIILNIVLTIILMSMVIPCFAFEISDNEMYSKGECERLLTYNGMKVITTYIVYNKNGVEYPAYCLDVTKPGAEGGNYIVHAGNKVQDINVWRAIINGYPYKSLAELGAANEGEAFTATKHAVYTLLYNRNIDDYGPIDSDAGRRTYQIYRNIVNAARSSSEAMVNDINISLSTNDNLWKIDEKDSKFVSKVFKLNSNVSNGKFEVSFSGDVPKNTKTASLNNEIKNVFGIGENFKVLIPMDSLVKDGSFTINAKTELETKPVAYGTSTVPGNQDYALTGYKYEEKSTSINQSYVENITKLKIIKKEYNTENYLEGVLFRLFDSNKELVFDNLKTNKEGKIILEHMIPGKYYLEEVKTLSGYALYSDLIEIGLDNNEEFEVVVNNKKIESIKYEKEYEAVEVTPHKTETLINTNETVTRIEDNVNTVDVEKNTNITEIVNNKEIKKLPKTGY